MLIPVGHHLKSLFDSEMDPRGDSYIARLLLGPSWATPVADFAEEPYGGKEPLGN